MRIQHNIMAMSAYRNYTNNVSAMKKNLEKLSSGYKINRAGDDAAGLAISEKMRAQITGLETAQKNAKDGISLVQTAEGALTEVHDMLNRMVELASMSANGTYDNDTDRAQLQKEMDQLRSEINRIADSSNFNGINLLDGTMDSEGTMVKTNISILPKEAAKPTEEVGKNTVLKEPATDVAKTSFTVELHDLTFTATDEVDTLEVKIGDTALSLVFDAGETYGADDIAAKIAEVFADETDGAGGKIDEVEFEVKAEGTSVTFTQKKDPATADDIVKANLAVSIGTVEADGNIMALADGITGLADAGSVSDENAKAIEIVPESDEGAGDAVTMTAEVTANFAAILDEAGAKSGEISVKYTAADGDTAEKWEIMVGGKTFEAEAETSASGIVELNVMNGDGEDAESVSVVILTASDVEGLDEGDESAATLALIKQKFATAQATGATYTAPGGGGGEDEPEVVASEEALAGAGIDFKTDPEGTKLTSSQITAITGKITISDDEADIEVDLGKIAEGLTTNSSVQDLADAIVAAAKTAISAWNKANSETAGYKYENPRVSTDGTEDGIIAQAAGDSIQLLVDKVPLDDGDDDATGAAGLTGTYNVETTVNTQGKLAGTGALASTKFTLTDAIVKDGNVLTIGKQNYIFKTDAKSEVTAGSGQVLIDVSDYAAKDQLDMAGELISQKTNSAFTVGYDADKNTISIHEIEGQKVYDEELQSVAEFDKLVYYNGSSKKADAKSLTLQIGDTADPYNQLSVNIKDCHTDAMGIGKDQISIADQESAAAAVDAIKAAINYVSDVRGTLGATQNRLDHTINNLSVMTENIQDAESTIRDVDIAEEMMAYTKNNILIQSAQAMLAQANQVPQGVLQLLQ